MARVPRRSGLTEYLDRVLQAVIISMLLAVIGGAWKTYLDVRDLKLRFDYVYGDKWKVPEHDARCR